MRISSLEFIPVSVPYTHRERSSQVDRDGVSDIIVKATTNDGLTGWGESCSGADLNSVVEALNAIVIFGFPLGYYMGAQGSLIVFVALIFNYSSMMNKIDRKYGLQEEEE